MLSVFAIVGGFSYWPIDAAVVGIAALRARAWRRVAASTRRTDRLGGWEAWQTDACLACGHVAAYRLRASAAAVMIGTVAAAASAKSNP